MKAQQRRTRFDTRSVMLFAAMALGGGAALQAQAQTPQSSTKAMPYSYGPGTGNPSRAATTAFGSADTDKDGKLSEKEASKLPNIGQRFKALDSDKSGSLSVAEFEKGMHF